MTSNPKVVDANDTIERVALRLASADVGAMPICDGDRVLGIVTDRDIVTEVIAKGRNPAEVRVGELGTRPLVTIGADDSIEEAAQTMAMHKVRRVPVIDGNEMVGMVSQADIVNALRPEHAQQMVALISS